MFGRAWVVGGILDLQSTSILMESCFEVAGHPVGVPAQLASRREQLVFAAGVCAIVDGEVSDVGDVHHLVHVEARAFEVPAEHVGEQERAKVAHVRVAVDSGAAVVHGNATRLQGNERDHRAARGVVQRQRHDNLEG